MKQILLKSLISSLSLALLAACSSTPAPSNTSNSRYSITQDRAPTRTPNIGAIPEVIPVPLTRTMAGNKSPYTVLGNSYYVLPTEEGYSERGVASWYGEKFHGHKTSNGEVFDMYLASAAHKSLPIPSFLRVTNLDNNRSIIVRVNDRGPFHGNRIVDLSYAAAIKLGYADRGTARVQLDSVVVSSYARDTAIKRPAPISRSSLSVGKDGNQYLQVGAFFELSAAREVLHRVKQMTEVPVVILSVDTTNRQLLHRVRVGPISDPGEIRHITQSVVAANLGNPYTVTGTD